ncbi:hypothetical protein AOQ84DRAFT_226077, partial [Glonium stellatum]
MLSLHAHSNAGPRLAILPASISSRTTLSTRRTAIRTTSLTLNNQGSRNMSWWGRNSDWWKHVDPRFHKWMRQRLQDVQAQDQPSWKLSQINTQSHKHRCFSRTKEQKAQHSNGGRDGDKPEGMSDHEWARLNYIKSFKKFLEEDPYNALFGRSNQWLNRRERKSSWISEHFMPMLMPNDIKLNKEPKGKEDTTKSSKATATTQVGSSSATREESTHSSESSSLSSSSTPPHPPTPGWVYDPITGRMVMEQVEGSSEILRAQIFQNDAIDIPVKPFKGRKGKATITSSSSGLSDLDDGRALPYEASNPVDDALAEYEKRAKPYQVSGQGDSALDKALSDYENRQMAEHNYQQRHYPEFLLSQQEWLIQQHPGHAKQDNPAENVAEQPEKYIVKKSSELHISSRKQALNGGSSAYEDGLDPPALAFERWGGYEGGERLKSSATQKEWLVQEDFAETSPTNTYTAAPGKDHELKHILATPKKNEPEILGKLPRDDIDLLRPSDIRARMGITKETRKETDGEKAKVRAQLEKNFEHIQGNRERGLETSLERLIRVTGNRAADQGPEQKPAPEHCPGSDQEPSDLAETNCAAKQVRSDNGQEPTTRKLHDPISSLKDAMCGPPYDGYPHEPVKLAANTDKLANIKSVNGNGLRDQLTEMNREVEMVGSDVAKAEKEVVDMTTKQEQCLHDVALVREIRNIYEDRYGAITTQHRQEKAGEVNQSDGDDTKVSKGLDDYEKRMGSKLYGFTMGDDNIEAEMAAMGVNPSIKALFDYSPSSAVTSVQSTVSSEPTAPSPAVPSVTGTVPTESTVPSSTSEPSTNDKTTEIAKEPEVQSSPMPIIRHSPPSNAAAPSSTPVLDANEELLKPLQAPESPSTVPSVSSTEPPEPATEPATASMIDSFKASTKSSSTSNQETTPTGTPRPSTPHVYKVLAYDPSTDTLTTATTLTPPLPSTSEPPIPLPTALSKLSNPGKFLPHLPPAFEPITSTANLLILRETTDPTSSSSSATPAPATPPRSSTPQQHPDDSANTTTSSSSANPSPSTPNTTATTTTATSTRRINPI